MARLERERFESPALRALRAALDSDGAAPSRRIAQLRRLVDLLESRRNQFAALLMIPLQATAQLALAVESWRRAAGPAVLRWMAAVGEVEALSSLATFHFEHPEYPFPSIVDGESGAAPPVHLPVFDSDGARPSADPGRAARGQRPAAGRRAPADPGQRLEHVRQEHAAAHRRRQRGAGAGRRAGVRAAAGAVAAGAGRDAADQGLAAGRQVALLRRDHPPAADRRPRRGHAAAAVPARRDPARHQLARPPHRRRGDRPRPASSAAPSGW